jgi:hypothetical protein
MWLFLLSFAARPSLSRAADLKPETLAAFERYWTLTEARVTKQLSDSSTFLDIDTLPETERGRAFALTRSGAVYITRLTTLEPSGRSIAVPGGLVHDWLGAAFIPGATMADVLNVAQDYNHATEVYPEVIRSHLISRDGEQFQIDVRFQEHRLITVTVDTEQEVSYTRVDADHWYSWSHSTRVQQVVDVGKPAEHDLPVGHDDGYLWRINSCWRFAQQDGGVYLEIEAVSLTRDIPRGLGWLIGPFLSSVPRDSLEDTLRSTRSAVLASVSGQKPETNSDK